MFPLNNSIKTDLGLAWLQGLRNHRSLDVLAAEGRSEQCKEEKKGY